jgi:WD40 repeat protein
MRIPVIIFVMLILCSVSDAQSDTPPYLYYFSPPLNAFVIERADGSESRLLGQGTFEQGTNFATGEWSPSGRWFAGYTGSFGEGGLGRSRSFLFNVDGTQAHNWLHETRTIRQLAWSPVEDLMFVVAAKILGDYSAGNDVYLYDAASQTVITSFYMSIPSGQQPVWSEDGAFFAYFYSVRNTSLTQRAERYIRYLRVVTRTGEISDYRLFPLERLHGTTATFDNRPHLSSESKFIYRQGTHLVLLNLITSARIELPLPAERDLLRVEWQPGGTQALLWIGRQLWLLDANLQLHLIADGVQLPPNAYDYENSRILSVSSWSDDGRHAYFVDEEGQVVILDMLSGAMMFTPIKRAINIIWSHDGTQLTAAFHPSNRYAVLDLLSGSVYMNEIEMPSEGTSLWTGLTNSPDNILLTLGSARTVQRLDDQQLTEFTPHSAAAYASSYDDQYHWSSDSQWVIHSEIFFFAGGGGGPRANVVTHIDGSNQRELVAAFTYARWLPDVMVGHLDSNLPQVLVPQARLRLAHDSRVAGVAWSQDGSRLFSIDESGGVRLWDVESGLLSQQSTLDHRCDGYPLDCRAAWIANDTVIAVDYMWAEDASGTVYLEASSLLPQETPPVGWEGFSPFLASSPVWSRDATYQLDSPDGAYTFLEQNDDYVIVENATGATVEALEGIPLYHANWTPDSQQLVLVGLEDRYVWSRSEDGIAVFKQPNEGDLRVLDVGNGWLASALFNRPTRLWSLSESCHIDLPLRARSIAFSPDGAQIALAGSNSVTLWNTADFASFECIYP